ncbi:EamA family transporter [Novosphingopyxis baekryungensis]|uniref:EamA family transporter n=1 Tax=Novosphingopyxis baekryungensis TaxID=279369 RepID=UPI0003B49A81|nr:EamA family transporter [Novosphingopyxis baekryungensis]
MRPLHFFLALAVMAVWGTNFVIIHEAIAVLPPLLFAALRFTIAFLPAAFFVKRPAVPLWNLAAFGLLIGVGQFGVLFIAMDGQITPGLASLVVQMQVFFTIGLSVWLTGERVKPMQIAALLLAAGGVLIIALHIEGATTIVGLLLTLFAGASWAAGNMVSRRNGKIDMLGYIVWSSLFPIPVLFALAFLFEGPGAIMAGLQSAHAGTWAAVIWQAVGNTLFGYGIWSWLLARHPAATVAPFALLVPIFGLGASALLLGEALPLWKIIASAMVIGGLAVGFVDSQRLARIFARSGQGGAA